jgi:hypothetical protein
MERHNPSRGWPSPRQALEMAPSHAGDIELLRRIGNMYRLGAGATIAAVAFEIQRDLDIRSVLPSIQAPTLVIHPENADEQVYGPPEQAD